MIEVHRLNGELFLLNSDMIETIDTTPDTVVRLLNGHRYLVREQAREICDKIVEFRRRAGYACIVANSADEFENPEEL
ncbi:MAG: flagellar FlbD family protein [Fretibacterium sp.]|nr:flagellar FlbD family protein [Fretibacterium sp.]